MPEFKERLDEAMRIRDISAAELSRTSKVNEGAISQYRAGKYKASQRSLDKLARALNVSIPWLMGADVPMTDEPSAPSLPSPAITKNLTADEANAFFQYLNGMGYFVRYDEERIGYHVISEDRSLDLFLSPEEFKRTARTSSGMIKGMLESMKHQQ